MKSLRIWAGNTHVIIKFEKNICEMEIAAEIEVSSSRGTTRKRRSKPSQDEAQPKKQKRIKQTLTIKHRRNIVKNLKQVSKEDFLAAILQKVDGELHIAHFVCRAQFWSKLKVSNLFVKVCSYLKELYISIYTECGKGKDKFIQFQLQWYQQCSDLLQIQSSETNTSATISRADCIAEWMSFRSDCIKQIDSTSLSSPKDSSGLYHFNSVMIAIQSAVYDYLNSVVVQHTPTVEALNGGTTNTSDSTISQESNDVYYRFGGAALAEMLKNRYKKIHCCPFEKRGDVVSEITVLKAMQCTDKSTIPASLQYRDKGYMYFPCEDVIQFVKAVDLCVRQFANSDGMRKWGKRLIEVATDSVKNNLELKGIYERALLKKFDSIDNLAAPVENVYNEMLRKLCNTRLAEFVDSFQQIKVSKGGSATLCGLNLRDTLLQDHVNLKTVIN